MLGLGIVAPLLVAGFGIFGWGLTGFTLLLLTGVSGLEVARELVRNEPRPARWMAWLFTYVWMGLSPLASMHGGSFPWEGDYQSSAILRGTLIVAWGMAFFCAAYRLTRPSPEKVRVERTRDLEFRRLAVFFGIAMAASVSLIAVRGGLGTIFASRIERTTALFGSTLESQFEGSSAGGVGTFSSLFSEVPPLAILLVAAAAVKSTSGLERAIFRRKLYWIYVAWIFLIVLFNPISTPRFWFGAINIAVVVALTESAAGIRRLLFCVLLGVVLVFPCLDYWRVPGDRQFTGLNPVNSTLGTKVDFDAFAMSMDAYSYTDLRGFRLGRQLIASTTFFAPRTLWRGKPQNTSTIIRSQLPSAHASNDNFSVPIWAELYVDGGLFLVAAGLAAAGAAAALLDQRSRGDATALGRAVMASFLGLELFILRGGLSAALSRLGFLSLSVLVTYALCSRTVETNASHNGAPGGTRPFRLTAR